MWTSRMLVVSFVVLSACSAGSLGRDVSQASYTALTTAELWSIQSTTGSPEALLFAEAELGSRGQTTYAGRFLGQRTAGTVGRAIYPRATATTGDRDCSDFPSAASAQQFFLSQGGPLADPRNLDGDGDGNACEWGGPLRQIAAGARPVRTAQPARVARPPSTGSRCYRRTRGGTYTITSGGNRNYSGC
jgi:hypothetical protein